MTVASCKATLAEFTKVFARAQSPIDDRERLASRNHVVRSTDVEEPAGFEGRLGCCRSAGEAGDMVISVGDGRY